MGIDDISEKVAKELNLSEHQVKQINRVQWKFLLDRIQDGEFKAVQLMYLGKWHKNQRFSTEGKPIKKDDRT